MNELSFRKRKNDLKTEIHFENSFSSASSECGKEAFRKDVCSGEDLVSLSVQR